MSYVPQLGLGLAEISIGRAAGLDAKSSALDSEGKFEMSDVDIATEVIILLKS